MTISSYSDFKSLVARRLHRSDLTDYIPDFILLAEARIYREMRLRQMETAFTGTIASGVVALPTSYMELKHAYVDGTPVQKLERKDAEWIYYHYPTRSSDSKPEFIARDASSLIFGPYPDSSYTIKGTYYKKLDPLSASNTSNWLITDAPDLLLAATMVEAYDDAQDDARMARWEGKYGQLKFSIESEGRSEEFSGGPISMTTR